MAKRLTTEKPSALLIPSTEDGVVVLSLVGGQSPGDLDLGLAVLLHVLLLVGLLQRLACEHGGLVELHHGCRIGLLGYGWETWLVGTGTSPSVRNGGQRDYETSRGQEGLSEHLRDLLLGLHLERCLLRLHRESSRLGLKRGGGGLHGI